MNTSVKYFDSGAGYSRTLHKAQSVRYQIKRILFGENSAHVLGALYRICLKSQIADIGICNIFRSVCRFCAEKLEKFRKSACFQLGAAYFTALEHFPESVVYLMINAVLLRSYFYAVTFHGERKGFALGFVKIVKRIVSVE